MQQQLMESDQSMAASGDRNDEQLAAGVQETPNKNRRQSLSLDDVTNQSLLDGSTPVSTRTVPDNITNGQFLSYNNNTSASASSTNTTALSIMHNIWDASVVGDVCFGDYSCTYNRHYHGRLYISNKAVLFYSNLFGYEKRLCLLLTQCIDISLYKTTSIRVSMMDGESHIFKSLGHEARNHIVQLVQGFIGNNESNTKVFVSDTGNESLPDLNDDGDGATSDDNDITHPTKTPRERAHSYPGSEGGNGDVNDLVVPSSPSFDISLTRTRHETENGIGNSNDERESEKQSPEREKQLITESWEAFRQDCTPYKDFETAFTFTCSVENFHNHFLRDDAIQGLAVYHENLGDSDIDCTKWAFDESSNDNENRGPQNPIVFTRTIEFKHSIVSSKSSKKFGSSFGGSKMMSTVQKEQKLTLFGTTQHPWAICLETKTTVGGLPMVPSNCFHILERWFLEPANDGGISCCLAMQLEIVFVQRTMLKSMLKKSILSETQEWYQDYQGMIVKSLQEADSLAQTAQNHPAPETTKQTQLQKKSESRFQLVSDHLLALRNESRRLLIFQMLGTLLLLCLFLWFYFAIQSVQRTQQALEEKLQILRIEQAEAIKSIGELVNRLYEIKS